MKGSVSPGLHFSIPPSLLALLAGPFLLAAVGCRSNNDLLVAELRSREFELRELRDELHRAECHSDALQHIAHDLGPGPHPSPPLPPELASQAYTLKEVKLGRGTGGYDEDGCAGDEALMVVLHPYDCDD